MTKLQRDGATKDREATDTDFTMRLPGMVFWLGFLCTLLGTVFLVLLLLAEDEGGILETILATCAMICLGAILMLYACMFRISVKDDSITVHSPSENRTASPSGRSNPCPARAQAVRGR